MLSGMAPGLRWALFGVFALLSLATLLVVALRAARPQMDVTELWLRIKSWWVMVIIFSLALILSRTISVIFLGAVSFFALKEYLSLVPTRRADRRVLLLPYLAVPIQYWFVAEAWYGMFIIFVPVYVFLILPMTMVLIGETKGFLRAAGTLHWGVMTTVFSLSHAAYLLVLPPEGNPPAGGAGLLFYLVLLTQMNDVAQYVWGKALGNKKVIPSVSPGKTQAGLVGGVLTTTVLAVGLSGWLTPLSWLEAGAVGFLIGVAGFLGDVTISAIKRDLGVKDSGQLIPGHGGILDRVDSLTYSAPLFFHIVYYMHY